MSAPQVHQPSFPAPWREPQAGPAPSRPRSGPAKPRLPLYWLPWFARLRRARRKAARLSRSRNGPSLWVQRSRIRWIRTRRGPTPYDPAFVSDNAGKAHTAHDVDLEHPGPVIILDIEKRFWLVDSEIVDENVDLGELRDEPGTAFGATKIEDGRMRGGARCCLLDLADRISDCRRFSPAGPVEKLTSPAARYRPSS